jgi:phosphonate transport system substrate-binding protein
MYKTFLLLPILFLFYASATEALAAPPRPKKRLVVATHAFGDNNRLATIQPLARQMAGALRANLQLKSYRTVTGLVDAMRQGEVDVAFMDPYGYLLLQTDHRPSVLPLAVLSLPPDPLAPPYSCLIASKASGLVSLADLNQNRLDYSLVFGKRHSASGELLPRLLLLSLKIKNPEHQLRAVEYADGHATALWEAKKGVTDLAALSAVEYAKQLASGELMEDEVTLLWQSDRVPPGPVVCRSSFSPRDQKKLQKVLLQSHRKSPGALAQVRRGWPDAWTATRYRQVAPADYNSISGLTASPQELRMVLEQHLK